MVVGVQKRKELFFGEKNLGTLYYEVVLLKWDLSLIVF